MKEPKPNRVMLPAAVETVPGKPVQRWSAARKRDVVLRLLRGESIDTVSRQIGIEPFRLEQWRDRGLAALDAGLKERPEDDPLQAGLGAAYKRLGELGMENELLREKIARTTASLSGSRPISCTNERSILIVVTGRRLREASELQPVPK